MTSRRRRHGPAWTPMTTSGATSPPPWTPATIGLTAPFHINVDVDIHRMTDA